MTIYTYQADCGDAFRIKYIGEDGVSHNIFIDSGYERTYNNVLEKVITEIISAGELIDLWVVSHIHDDHIGGVIGYFQSVFNLTSKNVVQLWYYNEPRHRKENVSESEHEISSAASIRQGDYLTQYLRYTSQLNKSDITKETMIKDLYGLKITTLSPDQKRLNRLRDKFKTRKSQLMNYSEITELSEPASAISNDYNFRIEDFDFNTFTEDSSVENGSSIAIITEYNHKRILWLADSHPSIIVKSLKDLGFSEGNPLLCDWVKVSHHGSMSNNSIELYSMLKCTKFIISSNGENKHNLPNKACIASILRNKNRNIEEGYHFHFTYDNKLLKDMFKIDGKNVFETWNFSVNFQNESVFKIM